MYTRMEKAGVVVERRTLSRGGRVDECMIKNDLPSWFEQWKDMKNKQNVKQRLRRKRSTRI